MNAGGRCGGEDSVAAFVRAMRECAEGWQLCAVQGWDAGGKDALESGEMIGDGVALLKCALCAGSKPLGAAHW